MTEWPRDDDWPDPMTPTLAELDAEEAEERFFDEPPPDPQDDRDC